MRPALHIPCYTRDGTPVYVVMALSLVYRIALKCVQPHTHTHMHTHACTCTCTHTHSHTCVHTHIHSQTFLGVPTIKLLTCFPGLIDGKRMKIKIIQKTSNRYADLGMHLLEDHNCDIVEALEKQLHHDPEKIVKAVYKKWIEGTGRKPATWQTLVTVLRKIELNTLADEITNSSLLPKYEH